MEQFSAKHLLLNMIKNAEPQQNGKTTLITAAGIFSGDSSDEMQNLLNASGANLSRQFGQDIAVNDDEFIELKNVTFHPAANPGTALNFPNVVIFMNQIVGFVHRPAP